MREIKFRAWHKAKKQMHEVNSIFFGVQYGMHSNDYVNLVGLHGKSEYYREREDVEVMQYIGLEDVAGKPIYEGDILSMENASAQVVYDLYEFVLDYSHNEDEWCCDWDLSDHHRMEIIGNIYENPELLT